MLEHFAAAGRRRGGRAGRPSADGRLRTVPRRLRITLDQVRVFSAVAEREHLTNAAEALHMSQGSVSLQVKRLEDALGVPLFHRVGRHVRLTDIGRAVHRQGTSLLEAATALQELAAGYAVETSGEVSVVAGLVIGAHRLSSWLGSFVQRHPKADVRISIAPMQAALESLSSGEADVVILGASVASGSFETIALEETELIVVVAADHPLASRSGALNHLAEYRYLEHEHGSATQLHAARVLGDLADLSPTLELEEGALLAALHSGLGYAVMPRAIVDADIAARRLVVLPRRGKPIPVAFTAARRRGPQTPVVEAFWKHLQAQRSPSDAA